MTHSRKNPILTELQLSRLRSSRTKYKAFAYNANQGVIEAQQQLRDRERILARYRRVFEHLDRKIAFAEFAAEQEKKPARATKAPKEKAAWQSLIKQLEKLPDDQLTALFDKCSAREEE